MHSYVAMDGTEKSSWTVPGGNAAKQSALAPDGSKFYVTNGDPTVTMIVADAATGAGLATWPTTPNGIYLALSPDGKYAYVSKNAISGYSIYKAEIDTGAVVAEWTTSADGSLAVSRDGTRVYFANSVSNVIEVRDSASGALVQGISIPGATPGSMVPSADGTLLYVSDQNVSSPKIYILDSKTGALLDTWDIAGSSQSLAISPDGGTLYSAELGLDAHAVLYPLRIAPKIINISSATVKLGQPMTPVVVVATGAPLPALTASSALPAGLTLTDNHNGTATISGTPKAAGNFSIGITAANGTSPDATQAFDLTVTGTKAQKPRKQCVQPPKSLPRQGTKRLLGPGCKTNAGKQVKVSVTGRLRNRGDVFYYRVIHGRSGQVWIRTYGRPLKVTVRWHAPATKSYTAYSQRVNYKT